MWEGAAGVPRTWKKYEIDCPEISPLPVKTGIQTAQSGFPIRLGMTVRSESAFIDSLEGGDPATGMHWFTAGMTEL